MDEQHVRLKDALRARRWAVYRTFCREYDKAARTVDAALTGTYPSRATYQRWLKGDVKGLPYPDHCRVLEAMLTDWTAEQLFEPCAPPCPQELSTGPSDGFTGAIAGRIQAGLTDPDATRSSWGQRPAGAGRPSADRSSTDLKDVPIHERLARRVTNLGHVLRLPPDEVAEIAALAGNLVDLSLTIDLTIAPDGVCKVTYRYSSLNLTDRPINRAPRDLWFQHSRTKLRTDRAARGTDPKNPSNDCTLRTTSRSSRANCRHRSSLGSPRRSATRAPERSSARTSTGGRRSLGTPASTHFTSATRDLATVRGSLLRRSCPTVRKLSRTHPITWDYDGDDLIMTFTRDHLQPNQYATLHPLGRRPLRGTALREQRGSTHRVARAVLLARPPRPQDHSTHTGPDRRARHRHPLQGRARCRQETRQG